MDVKSMQVAVVYISEVIKVVTEVPLKHCMETKNKTKKKKKKKNNSRRYYNYNEYKVSMSSRDRNRASRAFIPRSKEKSACPEAKIQSNAVLYKKYILHPHGDPHPHYCLPYPVLSPNKQRKGAEEESSGGHGGLIS
jgi:hypothetical protein